MKNHINRLSRFHKAKEIITLKIHLNRNYPQINK